MILGACLMLSFVTACATTSNECAWVDSIRPGVHDIETMTKRLAEQIVAHNTLVEQFCR